ncbi:MAG: hypothetical protein AAFN09_08995 [Pseudomonadota bacterium]
MRGLNAWPLGRAGRIAALLIGLAQAAGAQVPLGQFHVYDTRFGQLQVIGGEVDQILALMGRETPYTTLLGAAQIEIRGGFGRADETFDWVLTSVRSPPSAGCPWHFVLVKLSADQISLSPPFGHCLEALGEISVDPGAITLRFTTPMPVNAVTSFRFDGQTLSPAP